MFSPLFVVLVALFHQSFSISKSEISFKRLGDQKDNLGTKKGIINPVVISFKSDFPTTKFGLVRRIKDAKRNIVKSIFRPLAGIKRGKRSISSANHLLNAKFDVINGMKETKRNFIDGIKDMKRNFVNGIKDKKRNIVKSIFRPLSGIKRGKRSISSANQLINATLSSQFSDL